MRRVKESNLLKMHVISWQECYMMYKLNMKIKKIKYNSIRNFQIDKMESDLLNMFKNF